MKITRVRVLPSVEWKKECRPNLLGECNPDKLLAELPTFDNTKLVAINTCPLWGIVRYTHHKTFGGMGRAMALEAGAAAHEVFAAHRLYAFGEYGSSFYEEESSRVADVFTAAGHRIFGKTRFGEMLAAVDPREDYRTRCQQFALTALYNSGFYDDPGDKRRTTTNIEEMCIAYMDKYTWENELPYWDGKDFLGIEIPVDVVVYIEYENDESSTVVSDSITIRFIGKADGVHCTDRTRSAVRVHENKTASRLGDAWEMSWETNHQPTGYMIALTALLNLSVQQAIMLGTCLPLPRAYTINGLARVVVKRDQWQFAEWFGWLLHTALLHQQFKDDPTNAPQYTHSCNRYFRPCSYIPLCASEPGERAVMFADMEEDEWSPLHETGETSDD